MRVQRGATGEKDSSGRPDLKETLDALKSLQAADSEIREFSEARDALREKLERLKEILARGEDALDEKRAKLADAEKWYREKNQELKDDVEKVKTAKNKLAGIAKSKEFVAAQKEIEFLRRSNQQKEEEILKLLDAIEEFKTSIAAEQAKLDELRGELRAEEASNAENLAELEGKIAEINGRKADGSKKLSVQMVRRYERIVAARNGVGVVEVSRDGTCLGCNRRVPPQMLIELLKFEMILNCPACQRFIYVAQSGGEAAAAG